jgi:hypothetical protein
MMQFLEHGPLFCVLGVCIASAGGGRLSQTLPIVTG